MISHSLKTLNLNENLQGKLIFPYEKENFKIQSTLRNFIVTAYRSYTHDTLKASSLQTKSVVKDHSEQFNEQALQHATYLNCHHSSEVPFFYVKIVIKSEDVLSVLQDYSDSLSESLEEVLGYCNVMKLRGKRLAFLSDFEVGYNTEFGRFISFHALVSKSIFYNDYRVTTNFPFYFEDYEIVKQDILNRIENFFPELSFEVVTGKI